MKKRVLFLFIGLCFSIASFAQVRVSGSVTDTQGEPVPGVTVLEQGTQNGVITDVDGNFNIEVAGEESVLVFSFVGMETQTITVGDQREIHVVMKETFTDLDEVVVIGYGVQKKALTTGANLNVSGEDLQKMNTSNVLQAMQSQSPGVNITQKSGQPGEGFKVNIRGIGTIGDSEPLYVIDGVAGGNINNLHPSDIESIDVLKDAASAAIYGARAANGVILVTTKRGEPGKVQISYDGYYGQQYMYKKPGLLNAKEYMAIMDETQFNEGSPLYDWESLLPTDLYSSIMDGSWKGTDWLEESYNEGAPVQSHAVSIAGGNEISTFSLGFSYLGEEGILGVPTESNYERYTVRLNSDHVIYNNGRFDVLKFGETLNYAYSEKSGIAIGNIYWNSVHDLLVANPLLPCYDEEGNFYDYDDKANNGWQFDGNAGNPIAEYALSTRGNNISKNHNLQMSAYLELQPMENLILRSQFGYKMSGNTYRSYDMLRHLNPTCHLTIIKFCIPVRWV